MEAQQNDEYELLSIAEVQSRLRLGRNNTYALFNSKTFPSIKIGNKHLITKKAFVQWLDKMQGKTISL